METLHKIIGGKAEALEFIIRRKSKVTDVPLQELKIKTVSYTHLTLPTNSLV